MNNTHSNILETTLRFLRMVEESNDPSKLRDFYHPETEQTEFPNAITKELTRRNLLDLETAAERGSKVMTKQQIQVVKSYVCDNTVIIEAIWRGTLAIPIGKLNAGDEMIAYFGQFFEYVDGKIYRQRNYDCFEPFA